MFSQEIPVIRQRRMHRRDDLSGAVLFDVEERLLGSTVEEWISIARTIPIEAAVVLLNFAPVDLNFASVDQGDG